MERRGIITFAAGATAGVTACAVLAAGLLGTGGDLLGAAGSLFRVPAAAAGELPAFDDCEQLRQWYVERALPQVGPYGLGGGPVLALAERSDASSLGPTAGREVAGDTTGAVGSSGTGTNTQEADVDESDVAKTDGSVVVRVSGRQLVVTDVAGSRPREVSRTTLPGPALNTPELLLRDHRVIVVGDEMAASYPYGDLVDGRTFLPARPVDTRTHLLSVDLTDPASPRVTADLAVDGGAISTRQYADGTVRVVVTTGYPPLDFVRPNRDRTPREATQRNRQIVRSAPVGKWLPGIRSAGGAKRPLVACSDVRHPRRASGFGTISVLSFPFDEAGSAATTPSTTAITAAGDLVYSSGDRLYVATTTGGPVVMPLDTSVGGASVRRDPTTEVHAFELDGDRTTYTASGSFLGTVRDRWSFSEHDGRLRVAAQLGSGEGPVDNGVLVLDERDGRLVETARVDGLGKGETIQSVRWFGDLAIVVTFRQTDPLYTVDLSDPDRPEVLGALKIPGYSSYLHPVGGDLLVGIGHDASADGSDLGAQAATFDLRDLEDVRRLDTYGFGPQTDVSAGWDPRTFTYLPQQRTLVTPVQDWTAGRSRFVALHVGSDGTLSQTASWATRRYPGDDVRTLPLDDGRIALVGDEIRLVDVP